MPDFVFPPAAPLASGSAPPGADRSGVLPQSGEYRSAFKQPRRRRLPSEFQPAEPAGSRAYREALGRLDATLTELRAEVPEIDAELHRLRFSPFATAEVLDANEHARETLRIDIERFEALRSQLTRRLDAIVEDEERHAAAIGAEAERLRVELQALQRDIDVQFMQHATPLAALLERSLDLAKQATALQTRYGRESARQTMQPLAITAPTAHRGVFIRSPDGAKPIFDGRVFIPCPGLPHGIEAVEVS